MRLWSIHPEYLDGKGLVALWREGLLAQKVLREETAGYRNHPQLARFKNTRNPLGAIASYLKYVALEAERRGYRFNTSKILNKSVRTRLPVSDGQLQYEMDHLLRKLRQRAPEEYLRLKDTAVIKPHPLFQPYKGAVEKWEVIPP